MSGYHVHTYSLNSHPDSPKYQQFLWPVTQRSPQLCGSLWPRRGEQSLSSLGWDTNVTLAYTAIQINLLNEHSVAANKWPCLLRAMNSQASDLKVKCKKNPFNSKQENLSCPHPQLICQPMLSLCNCTGARDGLILQLVMQEGVLSEMFSHFNSTTLLLPTALFISSEQLQTVSYLLWYLILNVNSARL